MSAPIPSRHVSYNYFFDFFLNIKKLFFFKKKKKLKIKNFGGGSWPFGI
jgi:hypothetical protein